MFLSLCVGGFSLGPVLESNIIYFSVGKKSTLIFVEK